MIEISIPVKTVQKRHHCGDKYMQERYQDNLKSRILFDLRGLERPDIPCTVTLTRVSPRLLESESALVDVLHIIRRITASWIIPGLKTSSAWEDSRLKWVFEQKKSPIKSYSVMINIS